MSYILIGNVVSLIGAIIMIAIGLLKKKNSILAAQCIQFGIMGLGNLILGGVSGFISNVVGIVRNLICFKKEFTLPLKIVFVVIQAILTIIFNQSGLYGWLPFFATVVFTWSLDAKNESALKLAIIIGQILWAFHDFHFQNYSALACDIFTVVTNIVGLFMIRKNENKLETSTDAE